MFRSSSKLLRYWMKKDAKVASLIDEIANLQFNPLSTQDQVIQIIRNKINEAANNGVLIAKSKWFLSAAITVRWQIVSERFKSDMLKINSNPETIRLATGDVYLWNGEHRRIKISKMMSVSLEHGDVIFVGPTIDKLPTRVYHNGLFVSDSNELLSDDNKQYMTYLGIKTPDEYTSLVNAR